jgi:hypothetical protein
LGQLGAAVAGLGAAVAELVAAATCVPPTAKAPATKVTAPQSSRLRLVPRVVGIFLRRVALTGLFLTLVFLLFLRGLKVS